MRPSDFNAKALLEGTRVEMEHTDDPKIAQEIAMDHLAEDANYYKKLRTIHLDLAMGENPSDVSWAWIGIGALFVGGLIFVMTRR